LKGDGRAIERIIIMKKRKNLWQKLKEAFSIPKHDITYGENTWEQEDDEWIEELDNTNEMEWCLKCMIFQWENRQKGEFAGGCRHLAFLAFISLNWNFERWPFNQTLS